MMNGSSSGRPFLFAEVIGIVGGIALIATTALTHRGPMIFLPYGALIVALAMFLRSRRIESFMTRFGAVLAGFMVATLILLVYLETIVNPARLHDPLWNQVWPLLIFLLIGSLVSAVIASVTPPRASST